LPRAAVRRDALITLNQNCEATVAYILTNDFWSAAGALRRPYADDDPLAAMRGIMMGTLLSLLVFWMPLAIALTQ
jgi:hypothetical protein